MANAQILAEMRARISAIEQGKKSTSFEASSAMGDNIYENTLDLARTHSREVPRSKKRVNTRPDAAQPDAFKKIVALVNVSERSQKAIRERLAKDGFTNEEIEEAVNRALDYGFIDDMRFATVLIRSRLSQGKGIAGIERELSSHGIELNSVTGWPEDFATEQDELERALSYLDRHPTTARNKRDGAYRKLMQRGFSSSVASSAARLWSESHL